MSDTNVYKIVKKKHVGVNTNLSNFVQFSDFLNKCDFHNLGFVGPKFTCPQGLLHE